ncbi:hypothetical protein [Mycobacterium simiae]|uniref:hypothetical protein n=1 Tax=Mycobacterium simiae TaxID=1784 RepID=UPI002613FC3C|nr:hypothetical protein [Mycobacterium simiae]
MILVVAATSIEHFDVVGAQLMHAIMSSAVVVGWRAHNHNSIDELLTRWSVHT